MQRSTERILTTHAGSLPRPPDLLEMINAKEEGRPFDLSRYHARVKSAVREAVEKQAAAGIDISADGEMGRIGFIPYVERSSPWLGLAPGVEEYALTLPQLARHDIRSGSHLGAGTRQFNRARQPEPRGLRGGRRRRSIGWRP